MLVRAYSGIDQCVKRYLPKPLDEYPREWSYLPADPSMMKDWERAVALRQRPDQEFTKKYQGLFGSLMHLVKYRPEIATMIGLCGTCLTFATEEMYKWLERCLAYLGRTRLRGVTFSSRGDGADTLRAYADSNWSETRSTTGFVIMLAGASISHASRRQHCITMSSTEAELVALCDLAIELIYVKQLVEFCGYESKGSVEACTDNKGAFDLCHRFTSAQHSRHVDRKMFKMRELRGAGTVVVKHIPTENNPADMFTKVLTRQVFERHARFVMNWAADERPPDERIAQDKTEIKKT